MLVVDVQDECSELTGLPLGPRLYKRISRTIDVLANKGNYDPLLIYVVMNVASGNVLTLPREVEVPIKININNRPAFSRSKLYEFSLNGPGSDERQFTGWQWLDQLTTPIMVELPPTGTAIKVVPADASYAGDDGKLVRIWGLDVNGAEISDTLTIDHTTPPPTTNLYRSVDRVRKDTTNQRVRLVLPTGDEIANYYPYELNPEYRRIKLSKNAAAVRMLCRRKTFEVFSPDDYIPLHSELALLLMLKAMGIFKDAAPGSSAYDEAEKLEKKAIQYLEEKQSIRDSAAQLASEAESASALNLSINNRDSVIVADIYDDACDIFGPIGREKIFDMITDARELLMNKYPKWQGSEGYVDLKTSKQCLVTLPRYVDFILGIRMGCVVLDFQNRWFEFHQGSWDNCTPCDKYREMGEVVTVADIPSAQRLVAINDLAEDDGATIRIFGYDSTGKRLRSPNNDLEDEENQWLDGFELTANSTNVFPDVNTPKIKRIERITRSKTQGYVKLLAYTDDNNTSTLIGYYLPDETEPQYRRIKLPTHCDWIRLRYRLRTLKISALTDPLHLKSKVALELMLRCLKAMKSAKPDLKTAKDFELQAVQFMREKEIVQSPGSVMMTCGRNDMADPMQGTTF